MKFFECCHFCPPTKRHPGCHGKCEDYIEQRALFDAQKEIEQEARLKESHVRPAKTDYLNRPVWRNWKR